MVYFCDIAICKGHARINKGVLNMLNITKKIENETAVFELEGRLDTVTSPDLENELIS